jgi:hypothetical protein
MQPCPSSSGTAELEFQSQRNILEKRIRVHTSVEGATDGSDYDLNCIETAHQIKYRSLLVMDSMNTDNVNGCRTVRLD